MGRGLYALFGVYMDADERMAYMENKQTYRVVHYGNKATRRDYSKVSSSLDLPDLVEIQTAAFEWFLKDGIKEVFDDIYPISNYAGNIRLKFLDYEFG